jgi:hypothetical protein
LDWDNKLRQAAKGTETINLKYDPQGNRVFKGSSANGNRKYIVDIVGGLPTILLEINPANGSIMKSNIDFWMDNPEAGLSGSNPWLSICDLFSSEYRSGGGPLGALDPIIRGQMGE